MDYTVRVDRPSEQVIPELAGALQERGMRVMITFDLQLARASQAVCHCPHHGTQRCTCQYAVLLVYASQEGTGLYRTITAHGRDGQVWLSLLKSPTLRASAHSASEDMSDDLLGLLLELAGTLSTEVVAADRLSPQKG